jgi:hypothetical protein
MTFGIFLIDRGNDGFLVNPSNATSRTVELEDRDGAKYNATLIKTTTTWSEANRIIQDYYAKGQTPDGREIPENGLKSFELAKRMTGQAHPLEIVG